MLTVNRIYKTYGIQPILQDISFSVSNNERIGLIGPNGCGKTTLMHILADIEQPDSGTVTSTRPNIRIGYLAQGMVFEPEATLQSTLSLNPASQTDLETEIASLASALSANPNDSQLQTEYDLVPSVAHHDSLKRFISSGGSSAQMGSSRWILCRDRRIQSNSCGCLFIYAWQWFSLVLVL